MSYCVFYFTNKLCITVNDNYRISEALTVTQTYVLWCKNGDSTPQHIYIDCIIDYFCTEPLKPLVLHTPL